MHDKCIGNSSNQQNDHHATDFAGDCTNNTPAANLPEVALVIKQKWCKEIFTGTKVWEIRGTATSRRGLIAVAQAGSKQIVGQVEILSCLRVGRREGGVIVPWDDTRESRDNFIGASENYPKHCIGDIHNIVSYTRIYAWVLGNKRAYETPTTYFHPNGCVRWVKLNRSKDKVIHQAQWLETHLSIKNQLVAR